MVPIEAKEPVLIYKRELAGHDFINLPQYNRTVTWIEKYKFVIGHNRFATRGGINTYNAHPFSEEHIHLVHNGQITNHWKLGIQNSHAIEPDSRVMAMALAQAPYMEVLSNLQDNDAAALVWYDEKEDALHLYRNHKRPMYVVHSKKENTMFFGSEAGMLEWLALRNGFDIKPAVDIGEDKVVTFTTDANKFKIEKVKPKPVMVPVHTPVLSAVKPKLQTTTEILKQLALAPGDILKFSFASMSAPKANSRHGELQGITLADPILEVVSYGVEFKKITKEKFLQGVLRTAAADVGTGEIKLIVDKVEETTEDDPSARFAKSVQQAVKKTINNKVESAMMGPNGQYIDAQEWKYLTKGGCADCRAALSPEYHGFYQWVRNNKGAYEPLCVDCQDKNVNSHVLM